MRSGTAANTGRVLGIQIDRRVGQFGRTGYGAQRARCELAPTLTSKRSGPAGRAESFDAAAADYNAFRLPYPTEVVQIVVSAGHLREGSRVLEVGCGTGQLSIDLARRGCELVAVEMGPSLGRLAQKNLAPFPRARVEVATFEAWSLPQRNSMPWSAPVRSTGSLPTCDLPGRPMPCTREGP